MIIVGSWRSIYSGTSNNDSCPDVVVSGSGLTGDFIGDCALIAAESPNGLKGGVCQKTFLRPADKANFVCQKQKEEVFLETTFRPQASQKTAMLLSIECWVEKGTSHDKG